MIRAYVSTYIIIASDMVKTNRKMNLPKITPTSHAHKLPPNASVKNPATAVITATFTNALIILMFFSDYMWILDVRELSFH